MKRCGRLTQASSSLCSRQAREIYEGGQAEIVYLDGRPNVVLVPSAQQLKWGP